MAEDFLPGLNGGPVSRNPDVPVKSARVCQWPGVESSATEARVCPSHSLSRHTQAWCCSLLSTMGQVLLGGLSSTC